MSIEITHEPQPSPRGKSDAVGKITVTLVDSKTKEVVGKTSTPIKHNEKVERK